MSESRLEKKYSQVVNILIFIFPIVINSLQVAGDTVLVILAMMGIYVAISQKLSPFVIKEIKVFSYLTFGYFIAVCLSVLFSGQASDLAHFIPRDLHFFFAPFIALAIFKAEINIKYLIMGVKVALLMLGIIILYQLLDGNERPSGVMNPAVFGNLAVSLFFVTLVFFQQESLKQRILSFLSLLSGLVIIIASGTRGAWLSFLLLSGVYLYFNYRQKTKLRKRTKFIVLIVIASIVSIAGLSSNFKDRSQLAYTEIVNWKSGDKSQTSIGLRLEMYTLALEKIDDVPFFGHGYRTSNIVVFADGNSPSSHQSYTFNHLHNAYLTQYFNGGFVLLGALLLLLFVPLRLFIKGNIQNHENPVYISGVMLTVGYASYGMVNILFGDTYMNGFYTFFLAIFMLLYAQSVKISST
jgi:O-antigen ligase